MKFAEAHFGLSKPFADTNKTKLRILQEIREQTGVVSPELEAIPDLPYEVEYIWNWYCDLSEKRRCGFQVDAINWTEIHAYFSLLRICPQRWEVSAISQLDIAYINSRLDDKIVVNSAKALADAVPKKAPKTVGVK